MLSVRITEISCSEQVSSEFELPNNGSAQELSDTFPVTVINKVYKGLK